jgi:hypothetical protein
MIGKSPGRSLSTASWEANADQKKQQNRVSEAAGCFQKAEAGGPVATYVDHPAQMFMKGRCNYFAMTGGASQTDSDAFAHRKATGNHELRSPSGSRMGASSTSDQLRNPEEKQRRSTRFKILRRLKILSSPRRIVCRVSRHTLQENRPRFSSIRHKPFANNQSGLEIASISDTDWCPVPL